MIPVLPITPAAPAAGMVRDLTGEQPLAQATVVSAPERLAETPRLLTLGATAVAISEDGVVQLRTPLGDLFLRASTPLPLNRPLTLQIPPGSPPDRVFLSIAPATAESAMNALPTTPVAAAPIQTPVAVKAGMIIPGLLFPAAQPGTTLPSPIPSEAAAAQSGNAPASSTTPASIALPPGEAGNPPGLTRPDRAALALTTADRTAPAVAQDGVETAGQPRLPARMDAHHSSSPGQGPQPLDVEILATGSDPAPRPTGNVPARVVLSATVIGFTTQNRPMVATPQGLLVLELPANIAPGETLTLALSRRPVPERMEITPLQFAAETDWPSLAEAVRTLGASDPATGGPLRAALPKAGPQLAPAMALFLNALRGPQARDWPGERVLESLRAERRGDVADAVAADVRWAADQAGQSNAAGWRCYVIPFLDDGQLARLQLAVRRDPEEGEDTPELERGGRSARFVVDVKPSRLGPVQLDGLLRAERLDMVLRCRRRLNGQIIAEIKEIFSRSIDSTGLKGAISVQTASADWVTIAPQRTRVGVTA